MKTIEVMDNFQLVMSGTQTAKRTNNDNSDAFYVFLFGDSVIFIPETP